MSQREKESDPKTLRQMNRLLVLENEKLHKRLAELTKRLAELEGGYGSKQLTLELSQLSEQMGLWKNRLFGDSTEKRNTEKTPKKKKKQSGHGPTKQPKLPIVDTVVELDEDERMCPACHKTMQAIDGMTEDSELIDVLRQQFLLRKIKRQKYRCRCGIGMKTAPPPVKHRARGRYSLDFAAYAAAEKYLIHNPLDRQRRAMCRLGLNVTTQTLWDQIRALAESLKPIYESLQDYILGADVIGVDETWWRLMDKKA